jgi:hypothetical protein
MPTIRKLVQTQARDRKKAEEFAKNDFGELYAQMQEKVDLAFLKDHGFDVLFKPGKMLNAGQKKEEKFSCDSRV